MALLPGEMSVTVQAAHVSAGSNLPVHRIVIHDEEVPVSSDSAESVANYFANPESGGSAHYVVDADSVQHCVEEDAIAWHAPPNQGSLGIEHNGFAKQSRDAWLSGDELKTLQRSAMLTAELCKRHNVPAVWLSVPDLLAGRAGITSHNNVSQAWHQSDHYDPGPEFPSDIYIQMVNAVLRDQHPNSVGTDPIMSAWPILGGHDPNSDTFKCAQTHQVQVKAVRSLLGALNTPYVAVPARDGAWDWIDANTVQYFQSQHGLTQDGIVGPLTLIALLGCKAPA